MALDYFRILKGLQLDENTVIVTDSYDPSVTGYAAAEGSLFLQDAGATGALWLKTGPGNFDWSAPAFGGPFQPLDADLTALAGTATTGIYVITGAGTSTTRTLVAPAAGITITNPDGVAGNPTFVLANDLAALEGLAGTGFAVRTAADTWTQRSIVGTAARISVSNGSGVAGDPTIDIDATYVGQTSITTLGTITTGVWNGTTIAIANGGTGATTALTAFNNLSPLTTKGDLLTHNGVNNIRLPVGTDGFVLMADSTQASGLKWAASSTTVPLNSITAATGSNSINNGDFEQVWNWALTTAAKSAFTFSENAASTGGAGAQYLLDVGTIAASTANPIRIRAQGNNILTVTNVGVTTLQGADTGTGSAITLRGGNSSTAATAGGAATLNGGTAGTSGTGGGVSVFGGIGGTTGTGGTVNITGGAGGTVSGNAGAVAIAGGVPVDGNGGNVTLTGSNGVGTNRSGGSVSLTAGSKTGTGTDGNVTVTAGGTAGYFAVTTNAIERFRIAGNGEWDLAGTPGTATYVLTSNGAGTPPTWQTVSSGLRLYKENPSAETTPVASGTNAVAIGSGSTASATNGFGNGDGSAADIWGSKAIANGRFATDGDAQQQVFVLRTQTTNATITEMFLDGTGGTQRIVLPNNSSFTFDILVAARRTDATGGAAGYRLVGMIKKDTTAASTVFVGGTPSKTIVGETDSPWDVTIAADTVNGALKLSATGQAAKTIRWVAVVTATRVTN